MARFSSTILGVGVPASMKIATLADFVKRARAEAGKFNSAAVPGITELAFDYFAHNAKIDDHEGALQGHRAGRERSRRRSAASLFRVLCDPAPATRGRPDHGAGADGARAGAEPARHSDRHRGGFPRTGNGRQCRPVRQPGRFGRAASNGSVPTSSRWPTTRISTTSSTRPRRRRARGGAKEFAEIDRAPTRPDRHDRQGARIQPTR